MVVCDGVSVIIPALDEGALVGDAVRSVRDAAEVIVVDGGSRDGTREAAEAAGARVLDGPACRGLQLRRGASAASGEWLVFLHADTRLEEGWAAALRGLSAEVCGGAFRFAVASPRPVFRWIEAGVALRCRLLRLPFGDQGIFARRRTHEILGGFAPFPLMEDVDFVRRLARAGGLAFLRPRAFTSPRRWERHGILATTLRNWWLLGLYAAGRAPARLAGCYERDRSWSS